MIDGYPMIKYKTLALPHCFFFIDLFQVVQYAAISGSEKSIRRLFDRLRKDERLQDIHYKESRASEQVFHRMKVRLKKEIVTIGVGGVDPNRVVGEHIKPEDWNALISRDDVRLIDTRNDYEYELGTFSGAT